MNTALILGFGAAVAKTGLAIPAASHAQSYEARDGTSVGSITLNVLSNF